MDRATAVQPYKNLSGRSGAVAFLPGADSILIEFEDGAVYLYTYRSTGRERVERMKALAEAGQGLCTYISRHVRDAYAERLR